MQRAALDKILLKLLLCSKIKLLLPPELCLKEAAQTLLEDPSGAGRFSCSSCGRPHLLQNTRPWERRLGSRASV